MKKIIVDPPVSDTRRDRVERQLFAQLQAVRLNDRADAVIPPPRRNRRAIGLAFAACAAAAALYFTTRDGDHRGGGPVASPSRVVTPVGGSSQVSVPGARLDAKSDTNFVWQEGTDGSITITLERGAVDCDVDPRKGKAPFRVIAGDVKVTVVGTRFTVTRTPNPRVDVAHGTVKVEAPGGVWLVEAGQRWPAAQTASVEPAAEEPPAAEEIEMDPVQVHRRAPAAKKPAQVTTATPGPAAEQRELEERSYRVALGLEKTDPHAAAELYRAIVTSGKSNAATALYALAELHLNKLKNPRATLDDLDELTQKFPGKFQEEAAWLRVQSWRAMGKRDEARGAAADYLRQFPHGTYAEPAARLTK